MNEDLRERLEESNYIGIGRISNYYGGLNIIEYENKYYWAIENYDGHEWQQIPKSLYDELIKFNEQGNVMRVRF